MNLLFSNDRAGHFPDSWYASTVTQPPLRAALRGQTTADVCIIGAGYTGLSCALHLAQQGVDVVLLDAHRAGFGASGRNGGQLGSGQRMEQDALEALVGQEDAVRMWDLAEDAKTLVKSLIAEHDIDCKLKPGVAHAGSTKGEVGHLHEYAARLSNRYGYDQIEVLDEEDFHTLCPSPDYKGGVLDIGAAHLHPLAFALGLAEACEKAGVRMFDQSHVHTVKEGKAVTIRTDKGQVTADYVVFAGNGYMGTLNRTVSKRVMPINNFIAATEPLGDGAARILTRDVAVADSKFVVNYFRLSDDKRLLFGGGESYGYRFPNDIEAVVRKPMTKIFPHLRDIKIDYAWGGTLAITRKRMPYLARLGPNMLSASGYSGHGVGSATQAGFLMSNVILGDSQGFDIMSRVPAPPFPGGGAFRTPMLATAMTWFALRDRLGF
jgi:gamma-glutamylputrescine oxidase